MKEKLLIVTYDHKKHEAHVKEYHVAGLDRPEEDAIFLIALVGSLVRKIDSMPVSNKKKLGVLDKIFDKAKEMLQEVIGAEEEAEDHE